MAQSGYGKILLFNDFCGPEIPIATNVAYGVTAGGCSYYLGDFKVTGELEDTDSGVVGLSKSNGWVRLTGTDEAEAGCTIGTEAVFSPALNGPFAIEARVETQAVTARNLFVGFCNVNADAAAVPPTVGATTVTTLTASDLCGFSYDSTYGTDTNDWHMAYNGGSTTGEVLSTNINADEDVVAGTSQVLRVEIDTNGTARWYIDGKLKQTVTNAVSTTVLQGALVGCFATTTTVTDLDVDYIAVEANRDWTV